MSTDCKATITALIECARSGEAPSAELRAHLSACPSCESRWREERDLTVHFGELSAIARAADISGRESREARALALLARMNQSNVQPIRRSTSVRWLAAAAAVILAIGVGYGFGARSRLAPAVPAAHNAAHIGGTVMYEVSADADSLSGDDFIAVPYAPPLSSGEMVRVMHAALDPQVLANMGIDVDPAWLAPDSGQVPADVVVGQDGFPRAVRIADTTDF